MNERIVVGFVILDMVSRRGTCVERTCEEARTGHVGVEHYLNSKSYS